MFMRHRLPKCEKEWGRAGARNQRVRLIFRLLFFCENIIEIMQETARIKRTQTQHPFMETQMHYWNWICPISYLATMDRVLCFIYVFFSRQIAYDKSERNLSISFARASSLSSRPVTGSSQSWTVFILLLFKRFLCRYSDYCCWLCIIFAFELSRTIFIKSYDT